MHCSSTLCNWHWQRCGRHTPRAGGQRQGRSPAALPADLLQLCRLLPPRRLRRPKRRPQRGRVAVPLLPLPLPLGRPRGQSGPPSSHEKVLSRDSSVVPARDACGGWWVGWVGSRVNLTHHSDVARTDNKAGGPTRLLPSPNCDLGTGPPSQPAPASRARCSAAGTVSAAGPGGGGSGAAAAAGAAAAVAARSCSRSASSSRCSACRVCRSSAKAAAVRCSSACNAATCGEEADGPSGDKARDVLCRLAFRSPR